MANCGTCDGAWKPRPRRTTPAPNEFELFPPPIFGNTTFVGFRITNNGPTPMQLPININWELDQNPPPPPLMNATAVTLAVTASGSFPLGAPIPAGASATGNFPLNGVDLAVTPASSFVLRATVTSSSGQSDQAQSPVENLAGVTATVDVTGNEAEFVLTLNNTTTEGPQTGIAVQNFTMSTPDYTVSGPGLLVTPIPGSVEIVKLNADVGSGNNDLMVATITNTGANPLDVGSTNCVVSSTSGWVSAINTIVPPFTIPPAVIPPQ